MAKITRIPAGLNITAGVGDALVLALRITKNGQPFDASGWTLESDNVTVTPTDASQGKFKLLFTASKPQTRAWFVRRFEPSAKRLLAGFVVFTSTAGASSIGETVELSLLDGEDELELAIVDPVDTQPQQNFGSFFCDTGQSIAVANTAQVVSMNGTEDAAGLALVNNQEIVFSKTGKYLVNYSLQFSNASPNDTRTANVWYELNGNTGARANNRYDITARKAGVDGFLVASSSFVINVTNGHTFKLFMAANSTTVSLSSFAANDQIGIPATPCVKLILVEILRQ